MRPKTFGVAAIYFALIALERQPPKPPPASLFGLSTFSFTSRHALSVSDFNSKRGFLVRSEGGRTYYDFN